MGREAVVEAATVLRRDPADGATRELMARAMGAAPAGAAAPTVRHPAAQEAVRLRPEGELGYRVLAYAPRGLGRREEAVRAAQEGVRIEPQFWISHETLAEMLLAGPPSLGAQVAASREQALAQAREAVRLAPEEPSRRTPRWRLSRTSRCSSTRWPSCCTDCCAGCAGWLAVALVLIPVVSLYSGDTAALPLPWGQRLYDLGAIAVICAVVLWRVVRTLPPNGARTV